MALHRASPTDDHAYLEGMFAHESALQQHIRERAPRPLQAMMLSPYEGALLAWLAASVRSARIVEIGSFVGYSASWLLRALGESGRLHCIESDPHHAQALAEHLAEPLASGRLALHRGAASDVLPGLISAAPFDFVFIDADKRGTPDYLRWAERHLRPGGMVAIDNSLHFGAVDVADEKPPAEARAAAGWHAMREANAHLAESPAWHAMLLPTAGGLSVGIRA